MFEDFTAEEIKVLIGDYTAMTLLAARKRLTPDVWYKVISAIEDNCLESSRPEWLKILGKHKV